MARLLRALRLFAALADGGLWTHACRVSVSASWVPVPLCASWACRCGGQGPPFLLDFPHFFFFCFSFCARSLRPLAARSLRRLAPSCSNALSSGSVPWPSVPPLVLLVELCWISRWLLRRSLGHSVLAVQNLRLAHRRVFILLVGPRQVWPLGCLCLLGPFIRDARKWCLCCPLLQPLDLAPCLKHDTIIQQCKCLA
ncbi:hypothetical protein ACQJBY_048985 [Aegilops geniculata]